MEIKQRPFGADFHVNFVTEPHMKHSASCRFCSHRNSALWLWHISATSNYAIPIRLTERERERHIFTVCRKWYFLLLISLSSRVYSVVSFVVFLFVFICFRATRIIFSKYTRYADAFVATTNESPFRFRRLIKIFRILYAATNFIRVLHFFYFGRYFPCDFSAFKQTQIGRRRGGGKCQNDK